MHRALLTLLAAPLVAIAVPRARAMIIGDDVLNIATYSSPSGHYAVTVDPSHLHGQGKGSYRLTLDGKEQWLKELDFTLWDAVVTDRGEVAGYAYTHGYRGFSADSAVHGYGDFVAVILNPDGSVRLEEHVERAAAGYDMAPSPAAQGCFIDLSADRLVLQFSADRSGDALDTSQRWQTYKFSTGARSSDLKLAAPRSGGAFYFVFSTEPLRDTGLTCVLWERLGNEQQREHKGLRLSLVDNDAREVWYKEWPDEFSKFDYFSAWEVRPGELTPTVGLQPRQLAYRSISEKARITFEIPPAPAADGTYNVIEVARTPDKVVLARRARRDQKLAAPRTPVKFKGTIALQTGAAVGELRCLAVDHLGNLYAVQGRRAWVDVFDPTGKRLRTLKPDLGDSRPSSAGGAITVAGDGSVYLQPDEIAATARHYVMFDREGKRIGFQPPISGEVKDVWFFRPGTQERLVLGFERAFLVNAAGEKTRTIERRADRRWLVHPHNAAIAPSGAFVIAASPFDDVTASITFFSAAGDPIRTVDLPGMGSPRVAFNGTIACLAEGRELVFIDRDSGRMGSFAVPGATDRDWFYPYASPDGREVWLLNSGAKSLERYQIPQL